MPDRAVTAHTYSAPTVLPMELRRRRIIQTWLVIIGLTVIAMVVVGGATRMTNSGLSIVEWKPVTGVIPPLSEGQWLSEFEKYKQIPQYQELNQGMSLGDFKFIYWWEWSHRLLGRLIGLVFALPLALFWWRGWLDRPLKWKLAGLLVLGGSQGALGWWMVASGLSVRTDVSQYRLAMHMTLASAIFMAIVWVAASLGPRTERGLVSASARRLAFVLVPLVLLQIFLGGLVAGLDAGLSHNTWPLMDGSFIPPLGDLYVMHPAWVNHFENAMTVQFQHRMIAYLIVGLAVWQAVAMSRGSTSAMTIQRSRLVLLATLLQAFVGISTLLLSVPLWAGLMHQLCAVVLLAIATVHAQALSGPPEKAIRTA